MELLVFIILIFAAAFLLEKAVRKVFRVPMREGWLYHYVTETQRWTEWGIAALVLLGAIIVLSVFPQIHTAFLLLAFYFLLFGTRAWFEWKYDRQSRQYMMSICTIVFIALLLGLLNGPLTFIFE